MTNNKSYETYCTPQSVSLELRHVAMIADLVATTGLNRSQIMRAALEEYYQAHHPEETQTNDRTSDPA